MKKLLFAISACLLGASLSLNAQEPTKKEVKQNNIKPPHHKTHDPSKHYSDEKAPQSHAKKGERKIRKMT